MESVGKAVREGSQRCSRSSWGCGLRLEVLEVKAGQPFHAGPGRRAGWFSWGAQRHTQRGSKTGPAVLCSRPAPADSRPQRREHWVSGLRGPSEERALGWRMRNGAVGGRRSWGCEKQRGEHVLARWAWTTAQFPEEYYCNVITSHSLLNAMTE